MFWSVNEVVCRIHCVSISDSADYVYSVMQRQLRQFGLEGVEPKDIIDVTDDYTLGGHGCVNKELKGRLQKS